MVYQRLPTDQARLRRSRDTWMTSAIPYRDNRPNFSRSLR